MKQGFCFHGGRRYAGRACIAFVRGVVLGTLTYVYKVSFG